MFLHVGVLMLRRPLCAVCAAFSAAVFIILWFIPLNASSFRELSGELELAGRVEQKGYVLYGGRTLFSCRLKDIRLLSGVLPDEPEGVLVLFAEGETPKAESKAGLGGIIRVRGEAGSFLSPQNPGGFDAMAYYARRGLSFRLREALLTGPSDRCSLLREGLYRFRRREAALLERLLSPETASLLSAMLLGEKASLDPEVKDIFQRTGISHILAISGLHITILGMGLLRLLRWARLPLFPAAGVSFGAMLLYGLMIQAEGSTIRAIFMFAMHLGAMLTKRTYDLLTALSMASVFLLLEQPLYASDTGFLLSFGAVFSLGCFTPIFSGKEKLRKRRAKDPAKDTLRYRLWIGSGLRAGLERRLRRGKDSLASMGAITLGTLPLHTQLLFSFPLISIVLNLVVLPGIGLLLGTGVILLIAEELHLLLPLPLLALPVKGIAVVADAMADCLGAVSGWADGLGVGVIFMGHGEPWQVILFYLLLFILLWKSEAKWQLRALGILLSCLILLFRWHTGLEIKFLSVGQGDGILIRDGDFTMLIDGGSSSDSRLADYTLLPFLKYEGIGRLNLVLITHWDLDHCSGVLELLQDPEGKQIDVGALLLPETDGMLYNSNYERLLEAAEKRGIPVKKLREGDKITHGKLNMKVLNPTKAYRSDNLNDYSVVLQLEYGAFSALLTGDVTGEAEEELVNKISDITLLKVAHHGSDHSTPAALLERSRPDLAVISAGKNNRYGHPGRALLQRLKAAGCEIHRTDLTGAVLLWTDGKALRIRDFCGPSS